ncbi:hypothetical protein PV343_18630 [Streptomyces sp. WI03-4A]|uniref:hypothetical protein n=1 Tax=Streptomyces sp. WI03-4A TaxID=3028706 RepID=UPI00299FF897|nr:hypothetical protein [Streptomyces sp. WI03-4A]MDX2594245.1 hypothetical protein [Streptomyces sp. WI03-4A]
MSETQIAPDEPDEPDEPIVANEPSESSEPKASDESSEPSEPSEANGWNEPTEPAEPVRRRNRVAAVAGSVLLAAALVAGVGYTVVTVRGADRDAGAPTWKFPRAAADEDKAAPRHGLAGMLVPYGTGTWVRGPDIKEFGSDVELDGAQAAALRKDSVSGLPRSLRKPLEQQIDRQHITGMAMRSYFSDKTEAYLWNEEVFSVEITLSRMGDAGAARRISTSTNALLQKLGAFRAGPRIKGYADARCFRSPKGSDEDVREAFCSAYVGDVLVTATASGPGSFDGTGVARLLRTQLDRIAEPGAAV